MDKSPDDNWTNGGGDKTEGGRRRSDPEWLSAAWICVQSGRNSNPVHVKRPSWVVRVQWQELVVIGGGGG